MALTHKRTNTYRRFVFDPEDIEDVFPTANGVRIEFTEEALLAAAKTEGVKLATSRTIKPGAKKIWVTFRTLNAGDICFLRDKARTTSGLLTDVEAGAGTQQLDAMRMAVVGWDVKNPEWSEELIPELDSDLFDSIYEWVRMRGVPPEQDPVTGLPLVPETASESKSEPAKPPVRKTTRTRPRA